MPPYGVENARRAEQPHTAVGNQQCLTGVRDSARRHLGKPSYGEIESAGGNLFFCGCKYAKKWYNIGELRIKDRKNNE